MSSVFELKIKISRVWTYGARIDFGTKNTYFIFRNIDAVLETILEGVEETAGYTILKHGSVDAIPFFPVRNLSQFF